MRDRDRLAKELNKREPGVGLHERQVQVSVAILEVLLDIRDLLERRAQEPVVVDFVPPDYVEGEQEEEARK